MEGVLVEWQNWQNKPLHSKLGLLVLNGSDLTGLEWFWPRADIRVFADGAANHIFDNFCKNEHLLIPDFICGDLDSIRSDVASFFCDCGTELRKQDDQNTNDMEKCIFEMQKRAIESAFHDEKIVLHIVVLGGLGGRIDHEMCNFHVAYKATRGNLLPETTNRVILDTRVVILSSSSACCVLGPGCHILQHITPLEGPTCGIIPIDGTSIVTTQGLRWDLCNSILELGRFISSSNEITRENGQVKIECSHPLLWIVSVHFSNISKL